MDDQNIGSMQMTTQKNIKTYTFMMIVAATSMSITQVKAQNISTDRFTGVSQCVVEFTPTNLIPSVPASDFSDFLEIPSGVIFSKGDSQISYQLIVYIIALEPFGIRNGSIDFLIDGEAFRISSQRDYQLDRDPPIEISLWNLSESFVKSMQQAEVVEMRLNATRGNIEASISEDDVDRISRELSICLSDDW